jgi:hypothetical protein
VHHGRRQILEDPIGPYALEPRHSNAGLFVDLDEARIEQLVAPEFPSAG